MYFRQKKKESQTTKTEEENSHALCWISSVRTKPYCKVTHREPNNYNKKTPAEKPLDNKSTDKTHSKASGSE